MREAAADRTSGSRHLRRSRTGGVTKATGAAAPLRIGILGAGMIAGSEQGILPGLGHVTGSPQVTAIAAPSRTHTDPLAARYEIPNVFTTLEEMLESDTVDAVVNLTPVPAHATTSKAILRAGKHLVSEKPLALRLDDADELIDLASAAGRLIVCSPPRMLEPASMRARDLVRGDAIGRVGFARVRSSHAGPAWRAWPRDPAWYYAADAGPLLDMRPYGVQTITGILGPAIAVTAMSGRTAPSRRVAGGPFAGSTIPVDCDDNTLLMLDFGGATFAVVDCTFNVRAALSPDLEIFGHHGTLAVTNAGSPSRGSAVRHYRVGPDGVGGTWRDARGPHFAADERRIAQLGRALLVQHLVDCLASGEQPVLSAANARHTLEILLAARRSAVSGQRAEVTSTF